MTEQEIFEKEVEDQYQAISAQINKAVEEQKDAKPLDVILNMILREIAIQKVLAKNAFMQIHRLGSDKADRPKIIT